jgi:hypothetical protein
VVRLRRCAFVPVLCVAAALWSGRAAFAAAGKAERIGAFAGAAPGWVKGALDPQGYRVTLSSGSVAAEVWFRKDLAGLKPSAFVGVVTFPAPTSDFRGQAVRAGTYTLRYAEMPDNGDHLGAAPTKTFLLLSPVAEDTAAADDLTFEQVTKMSARTNGSNHPSPLNLADVTGQQEFPAVATNQYGHEVFYVKLQTSAGRELPIGLVVKGRTEHEV